MITEPQQVVMDWIRERHADVTFEELENVDFTHFKPETIEKIGALGSVVVAHYSQEHPTGADVMWIVRIYPDGLVVAKTLSL